MLIFILQTKNLDGKTSAGTILHSSSCFPPLKTGWHRPDLGSRSTFSICCPKITSYLTTSCGTHADLLIPSSCLNSTVPELVSHTFLRSDQILPLSYVITWSVYFLSISCLIFLFSTVSKIMEKFHVSGVAKDKDVARLALVGLEDTPGIAFKIFSLLAKNNVNVDIILQSIGRSDTKDISFTVAKGDMELAQKLLEDNRDSIKFDHIDVSDNIAKVSIVGAGMINNPGVAATMFEALFNAGININMISTSEIKVSVLVHISDADRAVQVIHDRFYDEFNGAQ